MFDPNLNSAHLESPRREEYRRARQALLDARGLQTVQLEVPHPPRSPVPGDTSADAPSQETGGGAVYAPFVILEGGRAHPLKIGFNTLGRLTDNDVVLEDPHISRRHCAVLVHSTLECEIQDTASKNGTYVNGERVCTPVRLKPGDEIQMCDLRLTFQEVNPPTP